MAIKKSELYSAIWKSCDELRGGMDASEYKNYVLTLLFIKYVTDKFKDEPYPDVIIPQGGSFDDIIACKNKPNIGEEMNKIIAKLAEVNQLSGIVNSADFDDEKKIGKGNEKVEKLTNLITIFETSFNFSKNKASGDDIIGDAYEYLMKNFATESGKSKGQFYTPAEVSRIIAKIIGAGNAIEASKTVYDPACGSGSLLIRASN
ncbi:MAG: N-6 DNA methylase, partial [Candidatus Izemoplasmatales bacterium]